MPYIIRMDPRRSLLTAALLPLGLAAAAGAMPCDQTFERCAVRPGGAGSPAAPAVYAAGQSIGARAQSFAAQARASGAAAQAGLSAQVQPPAGGPDAKPPEKKEGFFEKLKKALTGDEWKIPLMAGIGFGVAIGVLSLFTLGGAGAALGIGLGVAALMTGLLHWFG